MSRGYPHESALSLKNYAAASGQFKQLDANLREWVQKNADKSHDELNEELKKRKQN